MAAADPLTLTVRENAAWCDLVCRLHRFTPEGDGRLWWSARRTPDLFPDAVTLVPDVSVLDVLGRINDSVRHVGQGLLCDARPHGPGVDCALRRDVGHASTRARARTTGRVHVRRRAARSSRSRPGVVPGAARRGCCQPGCDACPESPCLAAKAMPGSPTVRSCTAQRSAALPSPASGTPSGAWADIADAVSHRHPEAWIVGYERGADLDAALAAGFTAIGPLRVWNRNHRVSNHRVASCRPLRTARARTAIGAWVDRR